MIGSPEIREYEEAKAAAVPNPYLWFHAPYADSESWDGGCATRKEAIEEGRIEYGNSDFAICEANKALVSPNFNEAFYAESIIEELVDNNEECWGENGQGVENYGPVSDLRRRLCTAVTGWLIQHPWKGHNFDDVRIREEIPAEPGDPRN